MAASYDFVQLDVFTQTPLAGNPLAVFTDARGLTDKQMQALAQEMNLSETTFILPLEPELEATYGKRVPHLYHPGGIAVCRTSNAWNRALSI
jgi:trans-2,3-dihydro-3-hydroxyanthranilate isomerase